MIINILGVDVMNSKISLGIVDWFLLRKIQYRLLIYKQYIYYIKLYTYYGDILTIYIIIY